MARTSGPRGRVGITAVAEYAQVSRQTVSNALNAPHRLHPDTLARVLDSIEKLGYRPNQAARSLRTRSSRLIGCRLLSVGPSGVGGVIDRFMHSLCTAARESNYDVLTFAVDDDEQEIHTFQDLMLRNAVDGFVVPGTHRGDVRAGWLRSNKAEFVAFGRPWGVDGSPHSWVDVDGATGVGACVEHVFAWGARRVGFIGWPEGSGVGDDRYTGWEAAARRLGLPTRHLCLRGEDGLDTGAAVASRLLDRAHPPDALVCVSDLMAIGAMRAVEARGLVVGRDVAVTGFDDNPLASVVRPGLTTVRQPLEEAAASIVAILTNHLAGRTTQPVTDLKTPTLVIRGTSTRP